MLSAILPPHVCHLILHRYRLVLKWGIFPQFGQANGDQPPSSEKGHTFFRLKTPGIIWLFLADLCPHQSDSISHSIPFYPSIFHIYLPCLQVQFHIFRQTLYVLRSFLCIFSPLLGSQPARRCSYHRALRRRARLLEKKISGDEPQG